MRDALGLRCPAASLLSHPASSLRLVRRNRLPLRLWYGPALHAVLDWRRLGHPNADSLRHLRSRHGLLGLGSDELRYCPLGVRTLFSREWRNTEAAALPC